MNAQYCIQLADSLSGLQAPVGYDEHSFGYRDLEGSKVHKALREEYGKPYREGDIIGCFIHMPEGGRRLEKSKAVSPSLSCLHIKPVEVAGAKKHAWQERLLGVRTCHCCLGRKP